MNLAIDKATRKHPPIGTISAAWEQGVRKGRARQQCIPDEPWTGQALEYFKIGWRFGMKQPANCEQLELL